MQKFVLKECVLKMNLYVCDKLICIKYQNERILLLKRTLIKELDYKL